MAPISEKLDAFFTEKMKEYPTKRSFLVPMLLYSQDEVGAITDDVVLEELNECSLVAAPDGHDRGE